MNAIETVGLTKKYGAQTAVKKLDLQVPQGSVCGFLGKNGAGKTTTIKMLVGLTKPSSGRITLMGESRVFGSCNNTRIGYLPDVPNFYGYMTAGEYLTFCGNLYRIPPAKLSGRIKELLQQVGLKNSKKHISAYSRGMKQRLGIAQALINEPDIVLMDEPISALDPIGRHEVMQIIQKLSGTVTVFFSTHILVDVETVCDHVVILDQGCVQAEGPIVKLKENHAANAARLRLYHPDDGQRFLAMAQKVDGLSVDAVNPVEFLLRSDNMQQLGKQLVSILAETQIPMQSYQAYAPSLEEIFLEVTAHA